MLSIFARHVHCCCVCIIKILPHCCMQPPPPPPPLAGAWLGLCGRVASIGQNGNEGGVAKGICLQLNATGACVTLSHYTVWETQYLASTQYIHSIILSRYHAGLSGLGHRLSRAV